MSRHELLLRAAEDRNRELELRIEEQVRLEQEKMRLEQEKMRLRQEHRKSTELRMSDLEQELKKMQSLNSERAQE